MTWCAGLCLLSTPVLKSSLVSLPTLLQSPIYTYSLSITSRASAPHILPFPPTTSTLRLSTCLIRFPSLAPRVPFRHSLVTGHMGIEGNEAADIEADLGAQWGAAFGLASLPTVSGIRSNYRALRGEARAAWWEKVS